jgi:hypothetical protein
MFVDGFYWGSRLEFERARQQRIDNYNAERLRKAREKKAKRYSH